MIMHEDVKHIEFQWGRCWKGTSVFWSGFEVVEVVVGDSGVSWFVFNAVSYISALGLGGLVEKLSIKDGLEVKCS